MPPQPRDNSAATRRSGRGSTKDRTFPRDAFADHRGRKLAFTLCGMNPGSSTRVDDALSRLKGLFLEMPSTALSIEQARRLTGLDESTCLALLMALEEGRFLRRSRAGHFLLRADPTGMDREER